MLLALLPTVALKLSLSPDIRDHTKLMRRDATGFYSIDERDPKPVGCRLKWKVRPGLRHFQRGCDNMLDCTFCSVLTSLVWPRVTERLKILLNNRHRACVIRLVPVGVPHVETQNESTAASLAKQILVKPRLITAANCSATTKSRQKLRQCGLPLKLCVRPTRTSRRPGLRSQTIARQAPHPQKPIGNHRS